MDKQDSVNHPATIRAEMRGALAATDALGRYIAQRRGDASDETLTALHAAIREIQQEVLTPLASRLRA
jgi:hypothetical protein